MQPEKLERFGEIDERVRDLLLDEQRKVETRIAEFARQYPEGPPAVRARAEEELSLLARTAQEVAEKTREIDGSRQELASWTQSALEALEGWGLQVAAARSLDERIDAIDAVHQQARRDLAGATVPSLTREIISLNTEVHQIDAELAELEEALARVEVDLIARAKVVATTLTRAYLRDPIQTRRFHTTILDEASMAPIPALWVAAAVADENVVIVGDPKQLAPIKRAQGDVVERWLGRDVFVAGGVADEEGTPSGLRHPI